ncbi:hypothetical protein Pan241w_11520 [Gimesia alba]|uniref:Uncharacterized protein n=1 Tax=Gimesia alba TaxID=2527973 RepID=A0A517RBA1_9PLAN|nr:hypothetical protein [Gimesia alba]QDT41093.1 hypothetical protein Pan241w_11520 [Gimesia alba]
MPYSAQQKHSQWVGLHKAAKQRFKSRWFLADRREVFVHALSIAQEHSDVDDPVELRQIVLDDVRDRMGLTWIALLWWLLPKLTEWFVIWWLENRNS